jgi:hypothetical protein
MAFHIQRHSQSNDFSAVSFKVRQVKFRFYTVHIDHDAYWDYLKDGTLNRWNMRCHPSCNLSLTQGNKKLNHFIGTENTLW